jgi:transposase-like protein
MTRLTTEEKRKIVELYMNRGETTRNGFCRQHQLNPSTLDYWVKRFGRPQAPGKLVAVKLQQVAAAAGSFTLILANGRRIEANWRFSETDLGRLIGVAEKA